MSRSRLRFNVPVFFALCITLLILAVAPVCADEMVINDVPAYDWHHGCSPTAGMMIMGYWDTYGYSNLIPGSSSVQDSIASPGHIADYALYDGVEDTKDDIYTDMSEINPGGAHTNDSLADFMGTSRSVDNLWHGATRNSNFAGGMMDYASWRGYTLNVGGDNSTMPDWATFTHEMNMGRPMSFSVDTDGDGETDHSVTAIGYRDTSGYQEYACRDTWGTSTTPRWQQFRPVSDTYSWGVYGGHTYRPDGTGTWDTIWAGGTGDWNSGSWSAGQPDSSAYVFIGEGSSISVTSAGQGGFVINHGAITQTSGNQSFSRLVIGNTGSYQLDGGMLTATEGIAIISRGGSFVYNGGTLDVSVITAEGDYTNPQVVTLNADFLVGDAPGATRLELTDIALELANGVTLTHSSGASTIGQLWLGQDGSSSTNTYNLSGSGVLSSDYICLGFSGSGVFNQSGGTVTVEHLTIGSNSTTGTYSLSGSGQLITENTKIDSGVNGFGTFIQTGGIHTTDYLQVGQNGFYNDDEKATYELQNGQLSTVRVTVGGENDASCFKQSGGTHVAGYLDVMCRGLYEFTGGNLNITEALDVQQVATGRGFFMNGNGTLHIESGAMADLTYFNPLNCGNASVIAGTDTMIVFPEGFDPVASFASYSSAGVTYIIGTPLYVPASQTLVGGPPIDIEDHVTCAGTLHGTFNMKSGLNIVNGGSVDCGYDGLLIVDDLVSGMSDGTLKSGNPDSGVPADTGLRVGDQATGYFQQTGGFCELLEMSLGYSSSGDGTYELSGDGELSCKYAYVGRSGKGLFMQDGGTYSGRELVVGCQYGSEGKYELSAGQMDISRIRVGFYEGSGHFVQTGGVVNVGGINVGSKDPLAQGLYEISDGTINAGSILVASRDTASNFIQSGGAVNVTGRLSVGFSDPNNYYGPGRYELSGGILATETTVLGQGSQEAHFIQTGGSHDAGGLIIYENGRYEYSDGQLNVGDLLFCEGEFDFLNNAVTLTIGTEAFADFRPSSPLNSSNASMTVGANTLAIFAAGFNPDTDFANYQNAGVSHVVGNTLVIPEGVNIRAFGNIDDHVECAGSFSFRSNGFYKKLKFTHGLQVLSGGSVDMGEEGELAINNLNSGLTDGTLTVYRMDVGLNETGQFTQDGGSNTVTETFNLGSETGDGTYILRGDGQFVASHYTNIGTYSGSIGHFIQEAGDTTFRGFYIAAYAGSEGLYEMQGGQLLFSSTTRIGNGGNGTFRQTGGSVVWKEDTTGGIYIGFEGTGRGTYEMSNGQMESTFLCVGGFGEGNFIQTGGSVTLNDSGQHHKGTLSLARSSGGTGTYELSDGQLVTTEEYIAENGPGTFIQTGGAHQVRDAMYVGYSNSHSGTFQMSGGSLEVPNMYVGVNGQGTLSINSPIADIEISNKLHLGGYAILEAVPGATIHMTGSAFENESTDPASLAGLSNLTLIFEGGGAVVDPFEVAGEDMGAVMAGFDTNFALGTLQLGGVAGIGQLLLVDVFDNRPGWVGDEALYVENLILGAGSNLDLNGRNLYYLSYTDLGGSVDLNGGSMAAVPEPATLSLLVIGGFAILRRRRRSRAF